MSAWPWFRKKLAVNLAPLRERILQERGQIPSYRGHIVGAGWRSSNQIGRWPESASVVGELRTTLALTQEIDLWATVHEAGSYHRWHRHVGVPWSYVGVLYLTTGGGRTLTRDPDFAHVPEEGVVVTFPPAILHASEPHEGLPRVVVAFNAR